MKKQKDFQNGLDLIVKDIKSQQYIRYAIWLLVAYQVFFTVLVLIAIHSLWVAVFNII